MDQTWRVLLALALLALAPRALGLVMRRDPPATGSPQDFISWLGPQASSAQVRTGIPASVVIAQAAHESGWGMSLLARRTRNMLGVKAGRSWAGPVISATTWEVIAGERVTIPGSWLEYPTTDTAVAAGESRGSLFRVYASAHDAVVDQARVYYNGLYEEALSYRRSAFAFLDLAGRVYATDPAYVSAVGRLIRQHDLTRWDVPPERWALDGAIVPARHLTTWHAAMNADGEA